MCVQFDTKSFGKGLIGSWQGAPQEFPLQKVMISNGTPIRRKKSLSLSSIMRGICAKKNFQNIVGHSEVGVAFGEDKNIVVRLVETGVKFG